MKNTIYFCPDCSNPLSEAYRTDAPTVFGNIVDGWECCICGCHTSAPEEDLCAPFVQTTTKYVLIEVADREINHLVYDNLDTAKVCLYALYDEVCDANRCDRNNDLECFISDDRTFASVNGSKCQFDWTIIEA